MLQVRRATIRGVAYQPAARGVYPSPALGWGVTCPLGGSGVVRSLGRRSSYRRPTVRRCRWWRGCVSRWRGGDRGPGVGLVRQMPGLSWRVLWRTFIQLIMAWMLADVVAVAYGVIALSAAARRVIRSQFGASPIAWVTRWCSLSSSQCRALIP